MIYNFYVYSYLYYGLLVFCVEVFKYSEGIICFCVVKDFEGLYMYVGVKYMVVVRDEGFYYMDCWVLVVKIFNVDYVCKYLKCIFGGVWNGGGGDGFK